MPLCLCAKEPPFIQEGMHMVKYASITTRTIVRQILQLQIATQTQRVLELLLISHPFRMNWQNLCSSQLRCESFTPDEIKDVRQSLI